MSTLAIALIVGRMQADGSRRQEPPHPIQVVTHSIDWQNAEFGEEVMKISDPDNLEKSWIITNTTSGNPKTKAFCSRCGCTLWTVFKKDGKLHRNVRVGLIENGYARARSF
ncbi:hypothetical protein CALVIDRAFT_276918 [Calocera viscosa TUFC12733]|uniref:CENP-V/GFA domain-containing protein n=1 Tax=Calocera viscosa (strain TUFC12733) TaxID=1330018 RepID=A0A167R292_CALVF|nr:hypothetical protein CALVIDRAFT_276918 [Calocera viscosa TUFC12733]